MLDTPRIAPVGLPLELVRGGSAWKARNRKEDPSISTTRLSAEEVIRDSGSDWRNRFNLPEIEVDLKGNGELSNRPDANRVA